MKSLSPWRFMCIYTRNDNDYIKFYNKILFIPKNVNIFMKPIIYEGKENNKGIAPVNERARRLSDVSGVYIY